MHNAGSYFSPTLANPITGINGALQFTGHGAGTCNCSTPVSNYFKNFGPRVGMAFQLDPNTVIRGSYGVMFTHGDAVGGNATNFGGPTVANGTLGFSAAPSFSVNGQLLSTAPLTGTNGAIPTFPGANGVASGPQFGTGYTTTSPYNGTPSSVGYADPYYAAGPQSTSTGMRSPSTRWGCPVISRAVPSPPSRASNPPG